MAEKKIPVLLTLEEWEFVCNSVSFACDEMDRVGHPLEYEKMVATVWTRIRTACDKARVGVSLETAEYSSQSSDEHPRSTSQDGQGPRSPDEADR